MGAFYIGALLGLAGHAHHEGRSPLNVPFRTMPERYAVAPGLHRIIGTIRESEWDELMTRRRRRAKDPLTAALSDIFLPAVRPLGFERKSARLIARISDGILQLLSFQKSAYGGGDFGVDYASMPLFMPSEYIVLEPGGRLTGRQFPRQIDRWWPSATHEIADQSMLEVVDAFHGEGLPFFESTKTVNGLLEHLLPIRLNDHHYEFRRGACLARLDVIDEAVPRLRRAVALYRQDGRDWCAEYADRATLLLRACESGTHSSLLAQWEEFSRSRLGLSDHAAATSLDDLSADPA